MQTFVETSEQYLDFAAFTRGESACFEEWALGVAHDRELVELIGALPPVKQQPNLAARRQGIRAPGGRDRPQPLDVLDDDAMAWLQNLVWPEQDQRRARLTRAIEVAKTDPPWLVRGDLVTRLPELIRLVPPSTTLIVFHSAVIASPEVPERQRFHQLMSGLVAEGTCH